MNAAAAALPGAGSGPHLPPRAAGPFHAALRGLLLLFGLIVALAFPAAAQAPEPPDYAAWEPLAARAEQEVAEARASEAEFAALRDRLVAWRRSFADAQSADDGRVASLTEQIAALGPVPAEGDPAEPAELAARRAALEAALAEQQAPRIAAAEAYGRADAVIRNIDRVLRERQTAQLRHLSPNPVNPANWPAALTVLREGTGGMVAETAARVADPAVRAALRRNLPALVVLLGIAAVMLLGGGIAIRRIARRLRPGTAGPGYQLIASLLSLLRIAIPVAAVFLAVRTLTASGLFGPMGRALLAQLPLATGIVAAAAWLGGRVLHPDLRAHSGDPAEPGADAPAAGRLLSAAARGEPEAEARFIFAATGLVMAVQALVQAMFVPRGAQTLAIGTLPSNISVALPLDTVERATAVLQFPLLLAGALLLFRAGRLMRSGRLWGEAGLPPVPAGTAAAAGGIRSVLRTGHHAEAEMPADSALSFRQAISGLLGNLLSFGAILGALLAAIGYIGAADALIWPLALSIALLVFLVVLQRLASAFYALAMERAGEESGEDALLPVLVGFLLVVAALPVLALIWGARVTDLAELWEQVRTGIPLGGVTLSPGALLTLGLVFALGYGLTRLLQGALRATVLPKTRLDKGGQNALVAGVGYVGIFLAAIFAITAAGIDLSTFAILASALSVGIGFGLQNIVQNFVAGIILMVERPISEGDWIEVGGAQGIVKAISVRSTRIETFDRTDVIVPNASFISGPVTNWTRGNRTGRLVIKLAVAAAADTRLAQRLLTEIAEAHPLVSLNPPPTVDFTGLAAAGNAFEMRMVLSDVGFRDAVRSEINHQIAGRFAAEGIALA